MNEFEHLFSQLRQGAVWTIFTVIGYIFFISMVGANPVQKQVQNKVIVSN